MTYSYSVMTLGQLRDKLRDLPDDTIVLGEFEEALQFNEIGEVGVLPASVLGHAPAVLLFGGQIVNYEYDLDARLDAQLGD